VLNYPGTWALRAAFWVTFTAFILSAAFGLVLWRRPPAASPEPLDRAAISRYSPFQRRPQASDLAPKPDFPRGQDRESGEVVT
jgi:hypothetical protein